MSDGGPILVQRKPSHVAARHRSTVGTEYEKDAKLKIDMDDTKKGKLKQDRFARTFPYSCCVYLPA